jgi:hypothetical protein
MAFADWSGNSLAEKFGSSNYHIKYLIDETGSIFKPQFSSSYFWNTDQAFGADTPINIAIYDGSGNIGQDYETTIYRPLKRFETIIYSSTGSLKTDYLQPGYNTTMSFYSPSGVATSPDTTVRLSTAYTPLEQIVKFNNVIQDDSLSWNNTTHKWVASKTFENTVNIVSNVIIRNNYTALLPPSKDVTFKVALYKNNQELDGYDSLIPKNNSFVFNLSRNNVNISQGDQIYVKAILTDGDNVQDYPIYIIPALGPDRTELIIQDTAVSLSGFVSASYFVVGNSSKNVLTASNYLTDYYGAGYVQNNAFNRTPIPAQSASGFTVSSSFEIRPYDQIRFMGDENQVYTVMSSSIRYIYALGRPIVDFLCLHLDRDVQTGTNLDDFSIRRLVDDPGFIIINNVPQQQMGSAPSFIIPKYASNTLKDNLDNIIQNLYQKNLI